MIEDDTSPSKRRNTAELHDQVPRIERGRYQMLFELGRGGMGSVFLAITRGPAGFNKLHVVKILKAELASDPDFLAMFLEEARLSARINHPNVVHIHEVGFDGKYYLMAMEYLNGQSLHSVQRRGEKDGRFTLHMNLRVIAEMLSGLHHAHDLVDFNGTPLNVVHRDVSPQNVFITYDGTVKVLDFGIAKASDSQNETRTGVIKGKVAYMAPEQFKGKSDRRVDIYAAGVMLWQALTGTRLWKGLNDVEIYSSLTTDGVPRPSAVRDGVPPQIEEICMKALAFKPEDRFQTAEELRGAIEKYLDEASSRSSPRDIGKVVGEMFADRQKETKDAIELRMKQLDQDRDRLSLSGDQAALSVTGASRPSVVPRLPVQTGSTVQLVADAGIALSPAPQRRKVTILAGVLGLAGIAVVGFGLTRNSGGTAPTPAAATSQAPVATNVATQQAAIPSQPTTTGMPAVIELNVTATPAGAKLLLDDVPIGNPFTGKFPRDGAVHKLRAEAAGHDRKDEHVAFTEATATVHLVLDKTGTKKKAPSGTTPPSTAAATPPTATATAAPPPTTDPAPTASAKKKTTLDPGDPWGKPPPN